MFGVLVIVSIDMKSMGKLLIFLVSVREHLESYESFVIQEWWPDSRRVTDVDGEEPRTLRP
jgi:hypothetical protein